MRRRRRFVLLSSFAFKYLHGRLERGPAGRKRRHGAALRAVIAGATRRATSTAGAARSAARIARRAGRRRVAREALRGLRDEEPAQAGRLLRLAAKAHASARHAALGVRALGLPVAHARLLVDGRGRAGRGERRDAAAGRGREQGLARRPKGGDGAQSLGARAEDEAEEDVDAPNGEEEEGRDKREVVDVVAQDSGANEALEEPDCAEPKGGAEHGEEGVEEAAHGGPGELGEEEDDDLEDDKQAVEHGPEGTSGLVRDSRVPGRYTVNRLMRWEEKKSTHSM